MLPMKCYQLDLFKEVTATDELKQDLEALGKSHGKVRRRLFAENAKLCKLVMELTERVERLERRDDNVSVASKIMPIGNFG